MMCLFCNTDLNTLKKANANKQFLTHKEHKYFALESKLQIILLYVEILCL